jgi:hypothetical protein
MRFSSCKSPAKKNFDSNIAQFFEHCYFCFVPVEMKLYLKYNFPHFNQGYPKAFDSV